jgi:tetratricopeptide (TPR) repeat protein
MLWTNLAAAQLGRLEVAGPRQQEKAIAAYQMALKADPEAPNVHYHLGLIYKERGELNRAGAFFQRALEVNPGDRDAQLWLHRITQLLHAEQQQRQEQQEEASTASTVSSKLDAGNAAGPEDAANHQQPRNTGVTPESGSQDDNQDDSAQNSGAQP